MRLARDDLEALEQRLGLLAAVRLDDADDDVVRRPCAAGARRLQHLVGLADAGRRAEEDLELPTRLSSRRAASSRASGEGR